MNRGKKILFYLAAVAVVALIVLALRPSPPPVSAVRGYFVEYVEEEGRTVLRDPYVMAAPIAGYLRRVVLDAGDSVEAEDVLVEIGNLSQLEVQVDLLSMDAVRVAEDMQAILTRWGGARDLSARVRRVEPAAFTSLENGRTRLRAVEPRRRSGLWTQIISSSEAGEIVITHPGDRVADGARIEPDIRTYR